MDPDPWQIGWIFPSAHPLFGNRTPPATGVQNKHGYANHGSKWHLILILHSFVAILWWENRLQYCSGAKTHQTRLRICISEKWFKLIVACQNLHMFHGARTFPIMCFFQLQERPSHTSVAFQPQKFLRRSTCPTCQSWSVLSPISSTSPSTSWATEGRPIDPLDVEFFPRQWLGCLG